MDLYSEILTNMKLTMENWKVNVLQRGMVNRVSYVAVWWDIL